MMKKEDLQASPKPKPPVPPKPILKSPQKSTSQTATSTSTYPDVGQTTASKPSTNENHTKTTRISDAASPISPTEPKNPSIASKPDKQMVRVESVESTDDQTCCSNLTFYICHKGPKNVARQVTNKPKPPAKPPKPSFESLARARAARRSIGDEIPAGREGLKYVDDTSTESSADYKDIVFDSHRDVSPASKKDTKSSQTADGSLADWEPLETSSRQSDHNDVFSDDVVFPLDPVVETKAVHFSPLDDLNATFQPIEAINYAVSDPIKGSQNPVTIRHSWPRRNKKKKTPPKRPPPPKNYHRVSKPTYYSVSDDERDRVDLSPETSPMLHRATVSNTDLNSLLPLKGNHSLTADGRYYCTGDKLSFYPYTSSIKSHFLKTEDNPSNDDAALNLDEAERPRYDKNADSKLSPGDIEGCNVSSLNGSSEKPPEDLPYEGNFATKKFDDYEDTEGAKALHTKLIPKEISKHSKKGASESKLADLNDKRNVGTKKLSSYENVGECARMSPDSADHKIETNVSKMRTDFFKPSQETANSSWPRRTKPTPPARPPPPQFHNPEDTTSPVTNFVKPSPPRPPPPNSLPQIQNSTISPSAPPRKKKKRSRTVEITPDTFRMETTTRQRSYSLQEDGLNKSASTKKSLGERKSLYTAISKEKKKPVAEPQIYDRMRFRPLPAPPPPPRKISKGKLDMLPLKGHSDSEWISNTTDDEQVENSKKEPTKAFFLEKQVQEFVKDSSHLPLAAETKEQLGSSCQQNSEKLQSASDTEQDRIEKVQQSEETHSKSFEIIEEKCSRNQMSDKKTAEGDGDKVQLERYETVHNL